MYKERIKRDLSRLKHDSAILKELISKLDTIVEKDTYDFEDYNTIDELEEQFDIIEIFWKGLYR